MSDLPMQQEDHPAHNMPPTSTYTMDKNGTDDPQGWAGVGSTLSIGAGPGSYSMPRVGPTSSYGKVTK